jgi:Flp pilus assembly protein TadD
MVLDGLGRHAEAAAALENAIRLAPREVQYHQSLGFTLESLGRRAEAVRSFKRALEFERSRELGRAVAVD